MPGLRTGDILAGRYKIERVLGRGGMAMVLEATHQELGGRVAIKVMHDLRASNEVVERFLREARAIFPLKSENVCRVLDMGRLPDGAPFMVMEYLEGRDFADEFRNVTCAPERAAAYIAQACKGLAEAHALGIVHRDIKPANLFLTRRSDGTDLVKVLDFGVSKLHTDGEDPLTADGQVLGTPRFMAPEQFGGSDGVDVRADVWAVGLVLYKLLTGTLPYSGVTMADIYAELMNDAPRDVREQLPTLDARYAAVVMRCLERSRAKRFPSARELAQALEPFAAQPLEDAPAALENPTIPTLIATPVPEIATPGPEVAVHWNRRRAAFVIGVVAAGGGAAFFSLRDHAQPDPLPTVSIAASNTPVTSASVVPSSPPPAPPVVSPPVASLSAPQTQTRRRTSPPASSGRSKDILKEKW